MKGNWLSVLIAAWGVAACSDDGPASLGPGIDFAVMAPSEISTKAVVDINVEILRASGVQYPLVVMIEKAYTGKPFLEVGSYFLQNDERFVVAPVPVAIDVRIRVTAKDSSPAELVVSKTIAIDVLDDP